MNSSKSTFTLTAMASAIGIVSLTLGCGPSEPTPCPEGEICYQTTNDSYIASANAIGIAMIGKTANPSASKQSDADGSIVIQRKVRVTVGGYGIDVNLTMEDTLTGSSWDGSVLADASGTAVITACSDLIAGGCDLIIATVTPDLDLVPGFPIEVGPVGFTQYVDCDDDADGGTPDVPCLVRTNGDPTDIADTLDLLTTKTLTFNVLDGETSTYESAFSLVGQPAVISATLTAKDEW